MRHLPSYRSEAGAASTEISCGVSYSLLVPTPTRTLRPVTYVWANASDGVSSFLRIYSVTIQQQISLKDLGTTVLSSCCARALLHVPGTSGGVARTQEQAASPLRADLVWVATSDHRILLYAAADPEKGSEVGRISLSAAPSCLVYHCGKVFVGLVSGAVSVFRRDHTVSWDLNTPATVTLGPDPAPLTCLLPVAGAGGALYAAAGRRIFLLDAWTNAVVRSFTANDESNAGGGAASVAGSQASLHLGSGPSSLSTAPAGSVAFMAVAGVGLWVALQSSSTVSLYHTESFIHMQDINIANNVSRVLAERAVSSNKRSIFVTALSAAKGLLWVGTNVGIALTIPLPRLEGVPIISGKANISYHAHFGPVRMFLTLNTCVAPPEPAPAPPPGTRRPTESSHHTIEEEPSSGGQGGAQASARPSLRKQVSDGHLLAGTGPGPASLAKQYSSPMLGARRPREATRTDTAANTAAAARRTSKTLPRGFSLSAAAAGEGADSVYGLYGDLLNVRDYECDSTDLGRACTESHRSDPELDTLQYRVSTLDRRVTMKSQRPRSLDLSSWSVESRASSHTTSSSDTCSDLASPSLSRNASFLSTRSGYGCPALEPAAPSTHPPPAPGPPPSVRRRVSCKKPAPAPAAKQEAVQRTVTTLMGGRGYIQWRHAHTERHRTSHLAQVNNSDAYLVIWDHKL